MAQAKGVAPTLSVEIVLTSHPTSVRWPHMGNLLPLHGKADTGGFFAHFEP